MKTNLQLIVLFFLICSFGMAGEIIQTQESSQNEKLVIELVKVKVRNNIVTIKAKIRNNSTKSEKISFFFKDIYLIDEENQKKYFILKDSEGMCIGGPFSSNGEGGRLEIWINKGEMKSIWAKLPAPTGEVEFVSIFVPNFSPFEEIPLAK